MMQNIIYNINVNLKELAVFLGIILFLGVLIHILTHKFDIHTKKAMYLGLITGLNTRQILSLCAILIRLICIIYSACVYTEHILSGLSLILVVDIIYIILNPPKAIFESINIAAQIVFLYLINVLRAYQIQVTNEMYVGQVVIALIIFIIIYSLYFFLKGFEDLIAINKNKNRNKSRDKNKKNKEGKHAK